MEVTICSTHWSPLLAKLTQSTACMSLLVHSGTGRMSATGFLAASAAATVMESEAPIQTVLCKLGKHEETQRDASAELRPEAAVPAITSKCSKCLLNVMLAMQRVLRTCSRLWHRFVLHDKHVRSHDSGKLGGAHRSQIHYCINQ